MAAPADSAPTARPPWLSPLRARGVGSPFSEAAWREAGALRGEDLLLEQQIETAEYGFTLRPSVTETDPRVAAYARLEGVLSPPPAVVVCFSWLKRGGAEWVGAQFVKAAQARYGVERVLVLVLDWEVDEARDWLASDTRLCVLMRAAPELSREERISFLLHYLLAARPALVMNCNSGVTWDVYRDHGADLALRSRLGAFAFCFDYTAQGRPVGYPESHLPAAMPHLSHVISDNEAFADDLRLVLDFPKAWLARIHAVAQPVEPFPPPGARPPRGEGARPLIAWASRIARQKRPEIFAQIARLRPQYDFVLYGDLYDPDYALADFQAANLRHGGGYSTLRDLPVQTFDAFLYTAAYDGLPNILLAAGMAGVPVVSACVGGIGEVLDEATGWPVGDAHSAAAYAEALDRLVDDPQEAAGRAERLYARLARRHDEAAFRERLDRLALFPQAPG